ncbi:MAG: hypothetical protein NTX44_03370 [Ignavibacteriales bacterium]|nr:hypothetical protein [Ignavibacteriales bacterium]
MKNFSVCVLFLCISGVALGQSPGLLNYAKTHRGNALYTRFGVHNGNKVGISFRNDGSISGTNANDFRGYWPTPATKDSYIGDVDPVVGIQLPLRDYTRNSQHISLHLVDTLHSVTITPGPRNGQSLKVDPNTGAFQGFEPEVGYVNLNQDTIAMSHIPSSWPSFWPDHPDWIDPGTGKAVWNGYFGKGVSNADQESYFVMDDAQDNSVQQRTNNLFHPDSTDLTRNGMGIVVAVRGFQWSQIQAQDVLFWLYDITNVGTTNYDKAVFGLVIGGCVGAYGSGTGQNLSAICGDNLAYFDLNNNLAYTWQASDNNYGAGWVPLKQVYPGATTNTGYAGYAYLESPGNPYDAIDNDNSNEDANNPVFAESDFTFNSSKNTYLSSRKLSRTNAGSNSNFPDNEIVLITPTPEIVTSGTQTPFQVIKYERKVVLLDTLLKSATDTETVYSQDLPFRIYDGVTLTEIPNNGVDDNLNGIIDENHDLHYERIFRDNYGRILRRDLRPLAFRDYLTGAGNDNTMIDKARDSGPGQFVTSWVPNYSQPRNSITGKYPGIFQSHWSGDENGNWNSKFDDVGADGLPSTNDFGEGDGAPTEGEPHFDKTDVNESDQLGLTSFNFFNYSVSPPMNNSEAIWNRMVPGYFDVIPQVPMDGDFIFASGYFPMPSRHTERFSLALVFGADSAEVFTNKQIVQQIYDNNYNFTRPPYKPILTAIPEDKKVTLMWDDRAESFIDYSIQEVSKRHTFEGYKIYRSTGPGFTENGGKPIATFDLADGIRGNFLPQTQALSNLPTFFLGTDIGLVHTFVDSSLQNGQTYFYAVTSFTKGDEQNNIYPAENSKYVTIDAKGIAHPDVNVAYVMPNAPMAGYMPATGGLIYHNAPLYGTGTASLNIVASSQLRSLSGHNLQIVFNDSDITTRPANAPGLVTYLNNTTSYSVIDLTSRDTILNNLTIDESQTSTVFAGMTITFMNDSTRLVVSDSSFGWSQDSLNSSYPYIVDLFNLGGALPTNYDPSDYQIEFGGTIVDTSLSYAVLGLTAQPVNFRVKNLTTGQYSKFCYAVVNNRLTNPPKTNIDIIIVPRITNRNPVLGWYVSFSGKLGIQLPSSGIFTLVTKKPFRRGDVFEFIVPKDSVNIVVARQQLDNIRVVPNPYVASSTQEPALPPGINSGRGSRKISFIHLPPNSTIYIFTSRGEMVRKLQMSAGQDISNGSVDWNLRTDANLEIAYGVYLYLVDTPGIGQKYGRIAVIK